MMRRLLKTTSTLAASVALALLATPKEATANTYTFTNISNNNAADAAIGESQLSIDVTDAGGGQLLFTFFNSGPAPSSITDIYFDDFDSDPLLSSIATINNGSGVSYSQGASPGNLPSGNSATPDFVTTAGFLADSDSPPPANGVNPGETVGIIFNLQSGKTFSDAIAALDNGDLRVGIHVQAFASDGSESFVNSPPIALPVPGTLILFGTGSLFAVVEALRRRRCK